MRKHFAAVRLAMLFTALLLWSGTVAQADETRLILTGSSTVAPLAAEIGKRFETLNPGIRIDVQSGGSSRGINDARSGVADIGMVSRAQNPGESDLKFFGVARDGVSIILHRDNPVPSLTDAQITGIFKGEFTDWKDVGGNAGRITVVNKAEGRSTLELFLNYFKLRNSEIKAHIVIGDNAQGIKTVAGNPGAIGYVSIGAAEFEAGQGAPIKLLPMSGVASSVENVRNGSFPLSRPLNFVTKSEPQGLARQFIDFARSRNVNDLIKAEFFAPLME